MLFAKKDEFGVAKWIMQKVYALSSKVTKMAAGVT